MLIYQLQPKLATTSVRTSQILRQQKNYHEKQVSTIEQWSYDDASILDSIPPSRDPTSILVAGRIVMEATKPDIEAGPLPQKMKLKSKRQSPAMMQEGSNMIAPASATMVVPTRGKQKHKSEINGEVIVARPNKRSPLAKITQVYTNKDRFFNPPAKINFNVQQKLSLNWHAKVD